MKCVRKSQIETYLQTYPLYVYGIRSLQRFFRYFGLNTMRKINIRAKKLKVILIDKVKSVKKILFFMFFVLQMCSSQHLAINIEKQESLWFALGLIGSHLISELLFK